MKPRQKATSPAPARLAAFELFNQWREVGRFADELLALSPRVHALDSRDRALTQEIFYGTLRRKLYLEFLLDRFASKGLGSLPEAAQNILLLSLYQLIYLDQVPDYAVINDAAQLARHAGLNRLVRVINGMLRTAQRKRGKLPPIPGSPDSVEHLSLKYSIPKWIIGLFLKRFNLQTTQQIGEWAISRPGLTLWVNQSRISRDELLSQIRKEGFQGEAHPECNTAIVMDSTSVTGIPGYDQGWWSVQDASAQRVVPLLNCSKGDSTWDCCAAPGGKALQLLQTSGNPSRVYLSDISPIRLRRLSENLNRTSMGQPSIWAGETARAPLRDSVRFHRILLDVPCSGLGVLSKRVDLRYRIEEKDVERLSELQLEMLTAASERLRPGGIIVYSTCTLTEQENQGVIERFLACHPAGWKQLDGALGEMLILPKASWHDGAYAAALQRLR